jgi:hypothetical protein
MPDDRDRIEKFKIQQLIYRYSDSVNRGDLEAMRSVYADDAMWESPLLGFRHESADAFVEFLRDNTTTTELLVQTPHCAVIELLGTDSARATTSHTPRTTFSDLQSAAPPPQREGRPASSITGISTVMACRSGG